MKTITPEEALRALVEGKSIAIGWEHRPIKMVEEKMVYSDGTHASLTRILECKNLRIYEEPKKQFSVALYAYFNAEKWAISSYYYKDDSSFKMVIHTSKFKRLDGTNGTKDTTMLVDEY